MLREVVKNKLVTFCEGKLFFSGVLQLWWSE